MNSVNNNNINNQRIDNNNNFINNNNQMNNNMNINFNNYNNINNFYNNNINNNNISNDNIWNRNNENRYDTDNNDIFDNKNEIVLYFEFENGKELYINVDESMSFKKAIDLLYDKYSWIKNVNIKDFIYNKRKLDLNKSIKENGLKDNANIRIIEGF